MNTAGFVPFLLQDNLDLSGQQQQVIQAIDQDLAQLLQLPPQQFWQVVISDDTLHTCLDSFLRFKRRCYDEDIESMQGSSAVLLQLSQRVFRVYWRMAHPQEQSTAAPAAKGQPPAPSASQVADMLYNKWLMDVPKMMDLAVLFAPGSAQLVQQLLHQLLVLQPRYAQDIFSLSLPLTSNLHELLESVKQLGDKVLTAAGGGAEAARKQLLPELAEAVSYFMDASLTLQALVECLPEAAALLLHPQHHGELLIVLAAIYSSTIPLLRRISQQPAAAAVPGLSPARIQRLQHCLECLVFHLLRSAFCTKQGALVSGGPSAVAALAAAEGGPSGSSSSSSSRPRPPGFGSSSGPETGLGNTGFNPEIQGQELMNLLMLLAHPSEVGSHAGPDAAANLLAAVNHAHHLDVAVSSAVSEGLLALDDAQFDYFLALVDGDRQLLQQRQQQQQQRWTQGSSSNATSSTTQQAGGASPAAGGAGSSSSGSQPRSAELTSTMVASVKELLPDYGDGFITAVLHHNSYNTEQTINCLLEGSLPPALQGLDHGLKTWSPPAAAGTPAPAAVGSNNSSGLSWTGLAAEAAAAAVPQAVERIPLPSLTAAAAGGPKAGVDRRTSRVLGAMSGKLRSVTKSIAQEMQFEYDDEYDDSFDDLMGPGNDGVCDIEGEDTGAAAAAGRAGAVAAAAGGDEYADEPAAQGAPGAAARRPQQQQQQQQRGGRPPRKEKLWVLDGKVYNYKKEGAMEVEGQAGAHAALKAAQQAALEIHGLGPGGNVPLAVKEQQPQQKPGAAAAAASAALAGSRSPAAAGRAGPAAAAGRGGGGRGGRGGGGRGEGGTAEGAGDGGGGGGGGGGRGRGRGSHGHKEQHKSAIANHHRRDRALQKQSRGML